jgi:exodeoxyribonuclease V gamma subunit
MIVHGNRLEDLRSLVVSWTQRYPLDPLENEVILVQSNGIAQWLKLALAEDPRRGSGEADGAGCGIAAAIDVQLPARFLWRAYRAALGRDAIPDTSPLDRDALVWRLMRLLPNVVEQAPFAPLKRFLADDGSMRKLHQLAERLADLFDQYQVYRADWLEDWAAGRDRLRTSRSGQLAVAAPDLWQPALWRALLVDLGPRAMAQSRAGVHRRFLDRMHAAAPPHGLPRRVIVFGISAMPAQTLEALAALAGSCQVLLCVHNPCRHHWTDIVADQDLLRHQYRRQQRKPGVPMVVDAALLHRYGHPLLAAWGKQGRDYINLLDSHDSPENYQEHFAPVSDRRIDLFSEQPATTLLSQLQDDILDLRTLEETRLQWDPVDARDASIRFHVAHSPQREVEILHDQLLDRFSTHPGLRPRDVIVMVPDIDTYAPHIRAVFGQVDPADDRYIPFTLADQGQRGNDPLLIAVEHLLRLPDSRFAVSEILDLLDVPAVRKRFGVAQADLPVLHRWIEGAGVRWGVDAGQRATLGLPDGMEQNTWHFGLRRMLLGYAVGSGQSFDGIEPYDEIGGLEATLIGPLADLLDALNRARSELSREASAGGWGMRLRAMLADFFVADGERDEALLGRLEQLLEDWQTACENAGLVDPLPLVVVREAWLAGLDASRLNQRFLAGSVNFCTLMPMRAIPFRVVCLLGMNDGDYPRSQAPWDFDLMGRDYRPGDRSRREDDRYLLLEALLSARDQLYVSWVGRSIRDNSERPPSVLIGQLRDHIAAGWTLLGDEGEDGDNGGILLQALTQVHPLQPFSARYFLPDTGDDKWFSYSREWHALHALRDAAPLPESSPQAGLPAVGAPATEVELSTLQRFARDPLKYFFNERLKVFFDEALPPPADDEPFVLEGLQRYGLSETLLLAARDASNAGDAEALLREGAYQLQRSGLLPLAGFGVRQQEALIEPLVDLLERYREQRQAWSPEPQPAVPVDIEIDGVRVEGWLGDLRSDEAGAYVALRAVPNDLAVDGKSLKWHRLIRPWVEHLAGNASGLALSLTVVATDITLILPPLEPDVARQLLGDLAQAWAAVSSMPPPVAVHSAFAWLSAAPDRARDEARGVFEDSFSRAGEVSQNPYLARQYPRFDDLWSDGAFAEWAQTLYAPLHQACLQALSAAKTGARS